MLERLKRVFTGEDLGLVTAPLPPFVIDPLTEYKPGTEDAQWGPTIQHSRMPSKSTWIIAGIWAVVVIFATIMALTS